MASTALKYHDDDDDDEDALTVLQQRLEDFQPLLRILERWRRARTCRFPTKLEIQQTEEDLLEEIRHMDL